MAPASLRGSASPGVVLNSIISLMGPLVRNVGSWSPRWTCWGRALGVCDLTSRPGDSATAGGESKRAQTRPLLHPCHQIVCGEITFDRLPFCSEAFGRNYFGICRERFFHEKASVFVLSYEERNGTRGLVSL